jgi:hypothetical protein
MITVRNRLGGAGTQNQALAFGGYPTTGATEEYNGTSWSTGVAMIVARFQLAGAGIQSAGLAFGGGQAPTGLTCTEEYNKTAAVVVICSL